MIKTITKIGNSQGIILDNTLMELAHLRVGDSVNVEVHQGGTITMAPVRRQVSPEEIEAAISSTMTEFATTMKRLA